MRSLQPSDASNQVIANLLARHPWPAPNLAKIGQTINGITGPTAGTASVISPSYNDSPASLPRSTRTSTPTTSSPVAISSATVCSRSRSASPLRAASCPVLIPSLRPACNSPRSPYVHTFGSNKVNELRYGWNRFAEGFYPGDQAFHPSSIGLCAATTAALCDGAPPFDSGPACHPGEWSCATRRQQRRSSQPYRQQRPGPR
jgi:hypothetical protein